MLLGMVTALLYDIDNVRILVSWVLAVERSPTMASASSIFVGRGSVRLIKLVWEDHRLGGVENRFSRDVTDSLANWCQPQLTELGAFHDFRDRRRDLALQLEPDGGGIHIGGNGISTIYLHEPCRLAAAQALYEHQRVPNRASRNWPRIMDRSTYLPECEREQGCRPHMLLIPPAAAVLAHDGVPLRDIDDPAVGIRGIRRATLAPRPAICAHSKE